MHQGHGGNMKPKGSVFIATSLDGHIARKDGDIEWLNEANARVPKGKGCGYGALIRAVDALVMGRNSYGKMLSFDSWSYGDTPVIVLSRKPIEFSDGSPETIQHSSEHPRELCERLSRDGVKHI
jgi:dihydrofolate reductase